MTVAKQYSSILY